MNASALLSRHRAVAGSTRSDAGGRECDLSGPCKEPPLPAASLRVDSSMSPHVPAPYAPPSDIADGIRRLRSWNDKHHPPDETE